MEYTTINTNQIRVKKSDLNKNLLEWLREDHDLIGAKNGCGTGACGACTVLIDNKPVRSCLKKVADVINKQVLTIEGLSSPDGSVHVIQQCFMDAGAIQCGFCTPGMVLSAYALLLVNKKPTRQQVAMTLNGNLCRCTGYQQIFDAVLLAASKMQKES